MISIVKIKKYFNENLKEEELRNIIETMYKLGNLEYQLLKKIKKTTNGKSNNLHKSIN